MVGGSRWKWFLCSASSFRLLFGIYYHPVAFGAWSWTTSSWQGRVGKWLALAWHGMAWHLARS